MRNIIVIIGAGAKYTIYIYIIYTEHVEQNKIWVEGHVMQYCIIASKARPCMSHPARLNTWCEKDGFNAGSTRSSASDC